MESLLTFMWRNKVKNPFSAADLKEKGGVIDVILWQRRYLAHLLQEYSKMCEVAETAAKLITKLRQAISSPLAMYELTEGDARDTTFAQTLPNEPLQLFFKHAHDVFAGIYTPELKGALTTLKTGHWPWAKFHETDRVKKTVLRRFQHSIRRPDKAGS